MENPNIQSFIQSHKNEHPCYGLMQENHGTAIHLDVRLSNGDAIGFEYHALRKPHLHAKVGMITINYDDEQIRIMGRNLKEIYNQLLRHKIKYIQEIANDFADQDEKSVQITEIRIVPLEEEPQKQH